jgi:hypothetical protein
LSEGEPYSRGRWQQQTPVANGEALGFVELIIRQPKAVELYYNTCAKINQHNPNRQDTLCLERKFVEKDWSKHVNLSIVAIIVVDASRAYSRFTQTIDGKIETQKEFYGHLLAELIDNQME